MPRFAANLSMMFNEVPFLDRFAAARQAGFEGVEFLFPYEYQATELRTRLNGEGLTQAWKQTQETHAIGAAAQLHPTNDLALPESQERHR